MFLKNRIELSLRPGNVRKFTDKDGYVFVIATIEELERTLGCGHNKVIRLKKSCGLWLIEEIKQGSIDPIRFVGNLRTRIQKKCF